MLDSNNDELKSLEKCLKEIDFQINNIVNAISQGIFYNPFKEKIDNIKVEKSRIFSYINAIIKKALMI